MPIQMDIRGYGEILLKYLVLDLNGTISVHGSLIQEIIPLIQELKQELEIFLLTADTFGTGTAIANRLEINLHRISADEPESVQKADFVNKIGAENTVALGNGRNDYLMLQNARIGIAILGKEGAAPQTLNSADIVCTSAMDGLKLLLNHTSLVATLRN